MSEQPKNTAEQAVDRKQFLFAGVYCAVLIAIFAIIGLSLGAQESWRYDFLIMTMLSAFTVSILGLSVEEVAVSYRVFPRIVSLMKQLEQDNENVLKLHAGDAITGTSFYSGVPEQSMLTIGICCSRSQSMVGRCHATGGMDLLGTVENAFHGNGGPIPVFHKGPKSHVHFQGAAEIHPTRLVSPGTIAYAV
eukprot:scaffold25061_cov54-Attheya_sp.AAC.1